MKKGSINELDFNILCKWILHKGTEVQAICNSMDVVAKECNLKMEKAVIQDKNTILNTIEKAADKFTQQMIDVTHDATDEFKEILSSKQRLSFRYYQYQPRKQQSTPKRTRNRSFYNHFIIKIATTINPI